MITVKKVVLIIALFAHFQAAAAAEPTITSGDHLFVTGLLKDCGPEMRIFEHGEVNEAGKVTFFEDISLVARGKPVHVVANELADVLEQRTGYRSKTIGIVKIPSSHHRLIMTYVTRWLQHRNTYYRCPRRPFIPDESPMWKADYRLAQNESRNNTFN